MKMLVNRKGLFASGNQAASNTHSMNSSFSSDCCWDSSSMVHTPTFSNGMSFDSVKIEDISFSTPTPSCTSDGYGNGQKFTEMSSITQEMMCAFLSPAILFPADSPKVISDQELIDFNNFSTYTAPNCDSFPSNHGLPTPSMDLDTYSPTPSSSQVTIDCVAPSQTTFMNTFDMKSPVRPERSLHFDLRYDSSASEYATDYSFGVSPTESFESFNSSYSGASSASNTPSRHAPAWQQNFEPLQSSAALHRVQETEDPDTKARAARQARQRIKRERASYMRAMIPSHIRVEREAGKKCKWDGCGKKFKRQEHLKRHEKTHGDELKEPCRFCDRPFGRGDNLKSHIWLHAKPPTKGSRTKHFPEAMACYEQMCSKPRKTKEIIKKEGRSPRTRELGH